MLSSNKNDLLYLLNCLESIGKIELYTQGCSTAIELFYKNEQLNFNACLNLLANIGENVSKISSQTKTMNPAVEWSKIKDFRNRIVYDYVNINTFFVMNVIQSDLPTLKGQLSSIIAAGLRDELFDQTEYQLARESVYYKHISFEE